MILKEAPQIIEEAVKRGWAAFPAQTKTAERLEYEKYRRAYIAKKMREHRVKQAEAATAA